MIGIRCYALWLASDEACKECEYSQWCKSAPDPIEKLDQHGKASVEYVESLEDLPPGCLLPPEDDRPPESPEARLFRKLYAECNHNPVTFAIVAARYGGLPYSKIAHILRRTKQDVLWHIKNLRNKELSMAIREMKVSKHLVNVVTDICEHDEIEPDQPDLFQGTWLKK